TFPNAKNDDQVDSTVFALAWSTLNGSEPYLLQYYKNEATTKMRSKGSQNGMIRVRVPPDTTTCILITARCVNVPVYRIIEDTDEESKSILRRGGERVD